MKRNSNSVWLLLLSISILILISPVLFAQEKPSDAGALTIPWNEFKTLLNLDGDELSIPLEAFHKLLAQAGVAVAPDHAVRNGNVLISKAEFQNLVNRMKPHLDPAIAPPFPYLITQALYSGKMTTENTIFTARYTLQVLKSADYLKVPVLPAHIALEGLKVDGKTALVVSEGGFHQVIINGSGEHLIEAVFSVKSSLERGPQRLDVPIKQTPITLLNLEIPIANLDIEIPQAQRLETIRQKGSTAIAAVIAPGTSVSIRWRKQISIAEKLPAKLYSEVFHLVSIEDDALKIQSEIHYNILHSEVDAVRLAIPSGVNVLQVYGEGVGDWQETLQQGEKVVLVPFTYGKKGKVVIQVITEVPQSVDQPQNIFSAFRTLETVRERGFVGIELNTTAELLVNEANGLERVGVANLPPILSNRSAKPLMMGFKYLKHPFSLVFDIRQHQKISVPVASVNSASAVTLFTEDGKIVHRMLYHIRNSAKQFLEMEMPEGAEIWSVFVNRQPVESSLGHDGKLLIPLVRSQSMQNRLSTFPVEVIYALSDQRFDAFGARSAQLPRIDLLTSQILWSVYLPNDYQYPHFSSTLEKEEMIRGLNVFSQPSREYNENAMREAQPQSNAPEPAADRLERMKKAYDGDYRSNFRNVPMEEKELSEQMAAELSFGQRLDDLARDESVGASKSVAGTQSGGILPIHIRVPTTGQVYRFARTIVHQDDPLTVEVFYAGSWTSTAFRWLLWGLLILCLYLLRKRIGKWLSQLAVIVRPVIKKIRATNFAWSKLATSGITPFIIFGLIFLFWGFSDFLAMFFLFLLWCSLVYHAAIYWRERRSFSKVQPTDPPEDIVIE